MENCKQLFQCVACGSENLELVLDLGKQPHANSYKINKDDFQPEFPLAINRCTSCNHVQLTHAVDPKMMFEDYLYVSGTSKTGRDHFEQFAKDTVELSTKYLEKRKPLIVLDVGCNDGTQLDYYKQLGLTTYGVDPAKNLHDTSSKNHEVHCGFFDDNFVNWTSESYAYNPINFDIITAQNVFAHGADPLGFLQTAKKVMHNDSLLFVQTSQANMIKNNEFDTIYHEHISFFNVNSMNELCKRAGMFLLDVKWYPIHGTSFVFVIGKTSNRKNVFDPFAIHRYREEEQEAGLYDRQTYIDYANKCNEIVAKLKYETDYVQQNMIGWHVIGYGAAAKGMTLLNYSKIKLDFVIDDNPLKQGRYTPGAGIPIVSIDKLDEIKDTTLFVPLAWNFFDEIKSKIKKKHDHQYDQFITYFPEVKMFQ